MLGDIFRGPRVRLAAQDPERDAEVMAHWSLDSEYLRLLDSDPARPQTARQVQAASAKRAERQNRFAFDIRTLNDDRLIGFASLYIASWASGDANVGIGIGERADRGQGYGTEAMRLVLRYAFAELNLARVGLEAFANNTRAIRSYEKAGFTLEGIQREWARRDGQRCDVVNMGILREEYQRLLKGVHNDNLRA